MVLMALEKPEGKVLFIGISHEGLKDLLNGQLMHAGLDNHKESLKPLGLSEVVITGCKTETDLIALVQTLFPGAPLRIHPGLYS